MAQIIDPTPVNQILEEETHRCVEALKAEQSRLGIKSISGELRNIKYKLLKKGADGIYGKIRFIFPRYGVFVHKGAGRGQGGAVGSHWLDKKGITIYTNPASRNKMNTGKRRAKEWFNPVVELFVDRLTERLKDYFISISYQRLKIK